MISLVAEEDHSVFARAGILTHEHLPRVAPALLAWETANVLWRKSWRGEIDVAERREMLDALADFEVALEPPDQDVTSALLAYADQHRLTAYDAAYLEMALRLDAPLATLDEPLTSAAKAEGLVVLSPFA